MMKEDLLAENESENVCCVSKYNYDFFATDYFFQSEHNALPVLLRTVNIMDDKAC